MSSKQQKQTASEVLNSLTGYDEIAIEQAFGKSLDELSGRATVRALIFVLHRREGLKDREAKDKALSIPMNELDDHFAETEDEIDEDDPETEQGKAPSADG